MGQKEFLKRLGFSENPFQFTNADEEEHLQSYFVPPPYFESVWGDPDSPVSQVIFAPRGGGKSAQRRMIEYRAPENDVFAITYDRFEKLGSSDLPSLGIDYHLKNIVELGLLGFLLEYHDRHLQAPAFSGLEREQLEALCQRYLGRINKSEALDAAKSLRTLSSKAKQVLRDWSGPINTLISVIGASQGLTHGLPGNASIQQNLSNEPDTPTKLHLEAVIRLVKSIGFKSIYVLIDKVDETAETGNNAEASFLLVKPLLRDLELLQTTGIGFKFFLWDKTQSFQREFARPDRLQQFELSWQEKDMTHMLSKRLHAFSNGTVTDLSQLVEAEFARPLHTTVVLFANGSPRDMIRVCQEILSEQLQINPDAQKIGIDALTKGISKFAEIRAKELLPPQIFRELVKVGRLDFTANYVASNIFKIEVNSARNKIVQWIQTGAVEKIGELHTGGRPVHQYAITDVRIAKAILPQLHLVDFIRKKLRACPQCDLLLIREWDQEQSQACHSCGTEFTDSE